MAEYRLTPAAEHYLEAIWTYTAQHWGVMQADRYIDFLTAAFDVLSVTVTKDRAGMRSHPLRLSQANRGASHNLFPGYPVRYRRRSRSP